MVQVDTGGGPVKELNIVDSSSFVDSRGQISQEPSALLWEVSQKGNYNTLKPKRVGLLVPLLGGPSSSSQRQTHSFPLGLGS
ncbi:unnamed protein product [Lota lota]